MHRAIWAKPSVNIEAYDDKLNKFTMFSNILHYTALLVQSRGTTGTTCTACAGNPTRGPFTECRRTEGHFQGCCGNCHWHGDVLGCSVVDWDEVDTE